MRILVVNWLDRENPQAGGAEEHLHATFSRIAANGHDVTALVSGWPGCARRANLDGIDVHRAGRRHTFSVAGPLYYRGRSLLEASTSLWKTSTRSPCSPPSGCRHRSYSWRITSSAQRLFRRRVRRVAATTLVLERTIPMVYKGIPCIAVSKSTRADLVDRGLRRELIEVVPNGVDVDTYTPRPETKTVHPTLLFLGRLKQYKRVDLVIQAVARLAADGIEGPT